ncbi:hypothetical protein Ddc_19406 [Ditylenchus destructor]|nr:hypothetical protein Ddc_19406 [Ditylenchus destructor]
MHLAAERACRGLQSNVHLEFRQTSQHEDVDVTVGTRFTRARPSRKRKRPVPPSRAAAPPSMSQRAGCPAASAPQRRERWIGTRLIARQSILLPPRDQPCRDPPPQPTGHAAHVGPRLRRQLALTETTSRLGEERSQHTEAADAAEDFGQLGFIHGGLAEGVGNLPTL